MSSTPTTFLVGMIALGVGLGATESFGQASATTTDEAKTSDRIEVEELRARAQLLHDVVHAALQVVHHHYYREDEGLLIPAAALKRVFAEVEDRHKVTLRWLAVDAPAMNRDHEPRTEYEKQAASLLARGKAEYELVQSGVYRRVAPIRLANECLKCHVPNRTSTIDRTAALLIEIPLRKK
jgi:hypothetical protein